MCRFSTPLALACAAALVACGSSRDDAAPTKTTAAAKSTSGATDKAPRAPKPTGPPGDAVAYFAGGCFWGVEHFLEEMDGVSDVVSGFMGGHVDSPSYKQVSGQKSGHLETVSVRYHSDKIGYRALAKRFFEIHDPTQADGQGPDIGPEYLSAVFYNNEDEKRVAQELIATLKKRGYDVVTTLRPAATFWPAEDYHQDYYAGKGGTPYCHRPVDRFGDMNK